MSLEGILITSPLEFPRSDIYVGDILADNIISTGISNLILSPGVQPNISGLGAQSQALNMNNNAINNVSTLTTAAISAFNATGDITYPNILRIKKISSPANLDVLTFDSSGNVTVENNLTVDNNLNVNGSLNYIQSSVISTGNASFQFLDTNIADTTNFGIFGKRITGGNTFYDGFFRNHADNRFYLWKNYNGSIAGNWISPTVGDLTLGNLACSTLTLAGTTTTSTGADINLLSGMAALLGVATASRALVLDSNKSVSGITSISAVTFAGQLSGTLTTATMQTISRLGNQTQNLNINAGVNIVFDADTGPTPLTAPMIDTLTTLNNGSASLSNLTVSPWRISANYAAFNGYFTYFEPSTKQLRNYYYDQINNAGTFNGWSFERWAGGYSLAQSYLNMNLAGVSIMNGTLSGSYPCSIGTNTNITGNLNITGSLLCPNITTNINMNNNNITNAAVISSGILEAPIIRVSDVINSRWQIIYGNSNMNFSKETGGVFQPSNIFFSGTNGEIINCTTLNTTTLNATTINGVFSINGNLNMQNYNINNCLSLFIGTSSNPQSITPKITVRGTNLNALTCASTVLLNDADNYAIYNEFANAHDNTYLFFDCYYDGLFRRAHNSNPYFIRKAASSFDICYASANVAGSSFTENIALRILNDGSTVLNNITTNSINVNNNNFILWNAVNAFPPSINTRSLGTRAVLWPAVSPSSVDYALGIDAGSMWHSVATASDIFKFYFGPSNVLSNFISAGLATFAFNNNSAFGIDSIGNTNFYNKTIYNIGAISSNLCETFNLRLGDAAPSARYNISSGNFIINYARSDNLGVYNQFGFMHDSQIAFSGGSVALPGYSFYGTTAAGMYYANNKLGLSTAGVSALDIDSARLITVSNGVKFPTTGGTAATLNFYEEYTATPTILGPFSATINIRITRIGKQVTWSIDSFSGTSTSSTYFYVNPGTIPARFLVTGQILTFIIVTQSPTNHTGRLLIYDDGSFLIYKDITTADFNNNSTAGISATGISYTL